MAVPATTVDPGSMAARASTVRGLATTDGVASMAARASMGGDPASTGVAQAFMAGGATIVDRLVQALAPMWPFRPVGPAPLSLSVAYPEFAFASWADH